MVEQSLLSTAIVSKRVMPICHAMASIGVDEGKAGASHWLCRHEWVGNRPTSALRVHCEWCPQEPRTILNKLPKAKTSLKEISALST